MPWKDTTTVEQKVEFICEWLSGKYTISELCSFYGISRLTAYILINRYEKSGIEGLLEKSRAPRSIPNKTKPNIEAKILSLKKKHPRWGAKKLHRLLFNYFTENEIPSKLCVYTRVGLSFLRTAKTARKVWRLNKSTQCHITFIKEGILLFLEKYR